jgi:nitrogen fixation protein
MGNSITDNVKIGTIGELLVQLRLLEHDVQAAPPIKDSGNDLIAVKGEAFRGVQVKTTAGARVHQRELPKHYHILAVVLLEANEIEIFLDKSMVYLVPRNAIDSNEGRMPGDLAPFKLTSAHVADLFADPSDRTLYPQEFAYRKARRARP